jgi:hypothetical protein
VWNGCASRNLWVRGGLGARTPGPCKSQKCSRLLEPRLCMAGAALSADVLALPMASAELSRRVQKAVG